MTDVALASPPDTDATETGRFIWSKGLKFPNDPKIIDKKRRRMLRQGTYEQKEFDTAMKLVQPGDTVVEVGAGMGYMSAAMAKKKMVKHVYAYEANPELVPYIHNVYAANEVENATVTNAVLGPRARKSVNFYVRRDFVESSLSPRLTAQSEGDVTHIEKIPVLNINTLFKKIKPTILVCDIEGAEVDLLPVTDMSELKAVVVELHPQFVGQAGIQKVFDAMAKAGLTYFPRASNGKVVLFKRDW